MIVLHCVLSCCVARLNANSWFKIAAKAPVCLQLGPTQVDWVSLGYPKPRSANQPRCLRRDGTVIPSLLKLGMT